MINEKKVFSEMCEFANALMINDILYIKLFNDAGKSDNIAKVLLSLQNKKSFTILMDIRNVSFTNHLETKLFKELEENFKELFIVVDQYFKNSTISKVFGLDTSEFNVVSNLDEFLEKKKIDFCTTSEKCKKCLKGEN